MILRIIPLTGEIAGSSHYYFSSQIWVTSLLLLISMLWHRQAIFESKGDKLFSSPECTIRTWKSQDTCSPDTYIHNQNNINRESCACFMMCFENWCSVHMTNYAHLETMLRNMNTVCTLFFVWLWLADWSPGCVVVICGIFCRGSQVMLIFKHPLS